MIPENLILNSNNIYEGLRIRLDGNRYEHCTFTNCILEFAGTGPVEFSYNHLINCRWAFAGPAEKTIHFLISIYKGLGPEGAQMVEGLFEQIRQLAKAPNVQNAPLAKEQDTTAHKAEPV
jgi:hypothetical protein